MTGVVYGILTVCALVFVVATAARAAGYARAPLHLRWELYPVPHEARDRAAHGGSYFEQSAWWTKPASVRHWATFRAMATEIVLLKALHEHNRRVWRRSFPFHFGLYLLSATGALVAAVVLADALAPGMTASALGALVRTVARATGAAGLTLVVGGAIGLLHLRLTDGDLRPSTAASDLFNLGAFVVAAATVGLGVVMRPADTPGVQAIVAGLLRWDTTIQVPWLLGLGLVLSALLVAYIPFTHMSHFVAKYFTYHAVRWDDAASRAGGRIERTMAEYLTYRPTWAAPHVTADGTRTWADVAATPPPGKKR